MNSHHRNPLRFSVNFIAGTLVASFLLSAQAATDPMEKTMTTPESFISPMATAGQQHAEQKALLVMASPKVQAARAKARALMAAHAIAETPDGKARLDYALDKWVGQLALQDVGRDLSNPRFVWGTNLAQYQWLGHTFPGSGAAIDCPDNIYRNVALSGSSVYEVVGQVSSTPPAQFSFHLTNHPEANGFDTSDDMIDVTGYDMITNDNIVLEADGSFRITLDNQPANGRPNHIQMPEGKALYLLARDTLSDWKQIPNRISVRRVGGALLPAPWTDNYIIERMAGNLEPFVDFWLRFNEHFHSPKANTQGPAYARNGGLGYASAGRFALTDDQVFMVTVKDGGARYAGMQVTDPWMIGATPLEHLSSYNLSQAAANADGTRTYLVAPKDPGYGNWVDTAGFHEGWVFFRWQGVPQGMDGNSLIVEQKLLNVADLPAVLPEGVATVSADQRRQQLENRVADWRLRIATGE